MRVRRGSRALKHRPQRSAARDAAWLKKQSKASLIGLYLAASDSDERATRRCARLADAARVLAGQVNQAHAILALAARIDALEELSPNRPKAKTGAELAQFTLERALERA